MAQKLLVLEPNSRMLEVIHNGVSDIVEMRHAGGIVEAEKILSTWPPDLILAEFRLADATGLELLEKLRRSATPRRRWS